MQYDKKNPHISINYSFYTGIFLFIITIAIFSSTINHEFVNYDDQLYITDNPIVTKGLTLEGLLWAFKNISAGFWFPLTWLSHMLDCQIFGLNPGGHHLTGLLIHSINAVFLFFLFKKMTGIFLPGLIIASIFAFHPLNVEPVAWASSRKDLLSTFFWILTMWTYLFYVKQKSRKNYLNILLIFSMGLMSKPTLVTLPFILILMDFWPLCRFHTEDVPVLKPALLVEHSAEFTLSKSITEKIPLFILSLASIYLTFMAEKNYGAVISFQNISISSRIVNAFISYTGYIYKSILPIGLSVHYPPYGSISLIRIFFSLGFLLVITYLSIKFRHRHPYFLFGWLWFLITLIPVIGLVQIGSHSMADRYCYVPLIGLSIIFSFGINHFINNLHIKIPGFFFTGVIIISLAVLTTKQLSYWQNSITLFDHAVYVNENDLTAHNNLALALSQKGREKEAIKHYYKALGIQGIAYETHFNLGKAFQSLKQYKEAIYHYKASLDIKPDYVNASLNLGTIFYQLKNYDEASHYFMNVLSFCPNHAGAHNNLGVIMLQQNKVERAIYYFTTALRLDPDNKMAIENLQRIKKKSRHKK